MTSVSKNVYIDKLHDTVNKYNNTSLLNCVPYVLTCQRALRAYVLTCQCALVLTCSRANVSYLLMCSRALRALRAYVLT